MIVHFLATLFSMLPTAIAVIFSIFNLIPPWSILVSIPITIAWFIVWGMYAERCIREMDCAYCPYREECEYMR